MFGVMGITGRSVCTGVAAAGEGEVIHVEDGSNITTGIEDASDDSCVDIRYVDVEYERSAGHGNAGNTDVILNPYALAGEFAGKRALDRTPADNRIERVLPVGRPPSRVAITIGDFRSVCRRLIQRVKRGEHRRHEGLIRLQLFAGQFKVMSRGEAVEIVCGGSL